MLFTPSSLFTKQSKQLQPLTENSVQYPTHERKDHETSMNKPANFVWQIENADQEDQLL